ncbi:MAG: TonB family protein [Ignavibacteriales bacterium]|nr:TonB family protein [Ignavibacteriales bacterium]
MKPLLILLSLVLFGACSTTQEVADLTLPELIVQYPLPAFPFPTSSTHLRIEFKILVNEDGTVKVAELLYGSGNDEWDSATIETIKSWRYTPALYKNKPIKLWLKQVAVIQFSEPQFIPLQEIVFLTKEAADSAYNQLEQGSAFEEIAMLYSVSPSRTQKGTLGKINIQIYPLHIKQVLAELNDDQITPPMKFGDRYVIYKRVKEHSSVILP